MVVVVVQNIGGKSIEGNGKLFYVACEDGVDRFQSLERSEASIE